MTCFSDHKLLIRRRVATLTQDGSVLLAPALDLFDDVAASQPAFREYLHHMYNKEVALSPDGKTQHLVYKCVL